MWRPPLITNTMKSLLFTLYLQTWGGVNGAGAEGGVVGRGFAGKDSPDCGTGAVLTAMIVR